MKLPTANFNQMVQDQTLRNFVAQSFSVTTDACRSLSAHFDASFDAISSVFSWGFDFVKYEIFTTYFQQFGLWFSRLSFPKGFEMVFHSFMDFVSLIWDFVIGLTPLNIFYLWATISSCLLLILIIQKKFDHEI